MSLQHARTLQAQNFRCIAIARRSVIATCAHNARAGSNIHRKSKCSGCRKLRAHCKHRVGDESQLAVRPSSQHARTLQAQSHVRFPSCGGTLIAACAHIADAELLMHCKFQCDLHHNLGAPLKRRIVHALQVAVRPSSQLTRTLQAQGSPTHCKLQCDRHRNMRDIASAESWMHCKLRGDRHRNMRAHSKRRISDASQVRVRPSSQHARTVQATSRRCIASARATVITACAHSAIARVAVIAACAQFLMHRTCTCDRHRCIVQLPMHRNSTCDRHRFRRAISDASQLHV